MLQKAKEFAQEKHKGQFRRDGITPYFNHCEKVASLCGTEYQKTIAYLHDTIEDELTTFDEIEKEFNTGIALDVLRLTHLKPVNYYDYIKGMNNETMQGITRIVKIADIVANLTDSPTQKQIEKYYKALKILAGVD